MLKVGDVVKELALAFERPIIPVYLEQAEIPETMEYQLAGIQRVESILSKMKKMLLLMAKAQSGQTSQY